MVHVDRNLTVIGRLPCVGNNSIKKVKPFATDPKFVVKILLDSIDKRTSNTKKMGKMSNRNKLLVVRSLSLRSFFHLMDALVSQARRRRGKIFCWASRQRA